MSRSRKNVINILLIIGLMTISSEMFGQTTVTHSRCLYNPLILVPEADFPDLADLGEGYIFFFEVSNGTVTNLPTYVGNPALPFVTDLKGELLEIDATIPTQRVSITIYIEGPNDSYRVDYNIDPANNLCNLNLSASSSGVYCEDEIVFARVNRSYEIGVNGIYDHGEYTNHEWRINYTKNGNLVDGKITHKNASLAADVSQFRLSMSYDYWVDGVSFTPEIDVDYSIIFCYSNYSKCEDAEGPYVFYPAPPEIDTIYVTNPTCIGGNASVTIKHENSSIQDSGDAIYQYTLVKYVEELEEDGDCQSEFDPETVNGITYCVGTANIYNGENKGGLLEFELSPANFLNSAETDISFGAGAYKLKIETLLITDEDTLSTCTVQEKDFIVEDPEAREITIVEISPPICAGASNGSVEFTIDRVVGSTIYVGDDDEGIITAIDLTSDLKRYKYTGLNYNKGEEQFVGLEDGCRVFDDPINDPIEVTGFTIATGPQLSLSVKTDNDGEELVIDPTCSANGSIQVESNIAGLASYSYYIKIKDSSDAATLAVNYTDSSYTYNKYGPEEYTLHVESGVCTTIAENNKLEVILDAIPITTLDITLNDATCSGGDGTISFTGISKTSGDIDFTWEIFEENDDMDVDPPKYYDTKDNSTPQPISVTSDTEYKVRVVDHCGASITQLEQVQIGFVRSKTAASVSNVETTNLTCFGTSEGSYSFEISNGTGPFTVRIESDGGTTRESTWGDDEREIEIEGLWEDSYTIAVTEDECGKQPVIGVPNFSIVTPNTTESIRLVSFGIASAADSISCYDVADGALTVVVAGGNSDYYEVVLIENSNPTDTIDHTSIIGNNTFIFAGLAAGVYYPIVTDDNGCSSPSFQNITREIINPPLLTLPTIASSNFETGQVAPFEGGLYAVCRDTPLSFVSTVLGGTGDYTYVLDGDSSFTEGSSVTYDQLHTLWVVDEHNCAKSQTFTIHNPPTLLYETLDDKVALHHGASVSCFIDTNLGQIDVEATGGKGQYTYHINDGVSDDETVGEGHLFENLLLPSDTITYKVQTTDALGCSIIDSVELRLPELVVIQSIAFDTLFDSNQISCRGFTAPVTISVVGGDDPTKFVDPKNEYNIAWLNTKDSSTDTVGTINGNLTLNLLSGSYEITVVDSYGCSAAATATFTLKEPAEHLTMSTAKVTAPECIIDDDEDGDADLGTISITASGGTGPSETSYPYKFVLFDGVMQVGDTVVSNDGTAEFHVPADRYEDKDYTLWVYDVNGCEIDQEVTMIADESPLTVSIKTATAPNCHDGTNGLITYEITNGTPRSDNSYDYILSGANLDPLNPQIITHKDNILTLDTLRDTKAQYAYGSQYHLYVVDSFGCDATLENVIDTVLSAPENLILDSLLTIRPSFQYQQDGLLSVHAGGGTGIYNYSLDGTNFVSSSLSDPSFWLAADLLAEEYTIYLRDNNYIDTQHVYCQREVTLVVPEGRLLTFETFDPIWTSCFNATDGVIAPQMYFDNEQPNEPIEEIDYDRLTIDWSDVSGDISGQATTNALGINPIENLAPGNYDLRATYVFDSTYNFEADFVYKHIQSKTDTLFSSTLKVNEPSQYKLTFNQIYEATCGSFDGSISIAPSGTNTNRYYNLDETGWVQALEEEIKIEELGAGSHQIAIGTEDGSCANTYSFTIGEKPVDLTAKETMHPSTFGASDGYITLSTTLEDAIYTRIDNGSTTTDGAFQNLSAGTYHFEVKNSTGTCQSEEIEIRLVEPGALSTELTLTIADCSQKNGSASASTTGGTPPYIHYWESNNGVDADSTQLEAGNYVLIVEDATGDTLRTPFEIAETLGLELQDLAVTPADCTYPNGYASFKIHNGILPYQIAGNTYLSNEIEMPDLYAGDTTITVSDSRG